MHPKPLLTDNLSKALEKERGIICVFFFPLHIRMDFEFLVLTRYEFNMIMICDFPKKVKC